MNRGKWWLRISFLVASACGFLGTWLLRECGMLPTGWAWWMAAYLVSAFVGWVAFGAILTWAGQ